MAVELRHLRYFQTMARELSFSRAARLMSVSQSSMSEQIQRLEDVIGVQLIDRSARPLRLTAPGELLAAEIGRVLGDIDDMVARVRTLGGQPRCVISVGYSEMAIGTAMPTILHELRERVPTIEIIMREQSSVGAEQALLAGVIDVAFIPAAQCGSGIALLPLGAQDILLAIAVDSPLARLQSPTLRDLAGLAVILPDEASTLSRYVMAAYLQAGLAPEVTARANRASSMLTLVAAEQGITFLPSSLIGMVPSGVTTRRISGSQLAVPFAMIWSASSRNPAIDQIAAVASCIAAAPALGLGAK